MMAGYETQLKDKQGNDVYPITMGKLVYMNDGKTLQENISNNTEITQKLIDDSVKDLAIKTLHNVSNETIKTRGIDAGLATTEYVNDMLDIGEEATVQLNFGTNIINRKSKSATFPKIEFTGHHHINILGTTGNCDDISKWSGYDATKELCSTGVSGNGIKVTLQSKQYGGYLYRPLSAWGVDINKYYIITAYVKNGNCGNGIFIHKNQMGGGVIMETTPIADTTKFTRVLMRIKPGDFAAGNFCGIGITGAYQQYAYVDCFMVNEITPVEYNSSSDEQLLAKYPYVDGYGALMNPCFENRKYNILRNGNCEDGTGYWTKTSGFDKSSVFSVVNGKFTINSTASYNSVAQIVPVKPNTRYCISSRCSEKAFITVTNPEITKVLFNGVIGNFNTEENTSLAVLLNNEVIGSGIFTYDHIMLVEGTDDNILHNPEYKTCEIERFVVEGQFTDDDHVVIDSQVSGVLGWKHKALYGTDYDWQFGTNHDAYKHVFVRKFESPSNIITPEQPINQIYTKYDGRHLKWAAVTTDKDNAVMYHDDGSLHISIASMDSGWDNNVQPNNDDVKAYMNGWRAVHYIDGRYDLWLNVIDKSLPNVGIQQVINSPVTGNTTINVPNGNAYDIGKYVGCYRNMQMLSGAVITGKSATTITFASQWTTLVGDIIMQADVHVSNYVKTTIAPGYNGYQVHYKLPNPEPINDTNVKVKGNIWSLASGENHITISSGIVLGEFANPYTLDGNSATINTFTSGYRSSMLRNPTEEILDIAKNDISNINAWYIRKDSYLVNSYGKQDAFTALTNFDPAATYSVDYQILKALHAQSFGSLSMSYCPDMYSAINSLTNALENKQQHNNTLDNIVTASIYEEITLKRKWCPFQTYSGNNITYVSIVIPYSEKVVVPKLTFKADYVILLGGVQVQSSIFGMEICDHSNKGVNILLFINNPNINSISAGIVEVSGKLIADSRGRI